MSHYDKLKDIWCCEAARCVVEVAPDAEFCHRHSEMVPRDVHRRITYWRMRFGQHGAGPKQYRRAVREAKALIVKAERADAKAAAALDRMLESEEEAPPC